MTYPQQPPPLPGPHPPANTTPRSKRSLWLVLGAVAALVALGGVGVTLYSTGVFASAASGGSTAADEASVSPTVKELSSPSAETIEPVKYRYSEKACAETDWGPLEELTETDADDVQETPGPTPGSASMTCEISAPGEAPSYDVTVTIFDTAAEAESEYEQSETDSAKKADGPWQQTAWTGGADDESAYSSLFAQDSNVYLSFHAGVEGGDSEADIRKAITTVAESFLTTITAKE